MADEVYESAEAITITDGRISCEWVMDFVCSFHMCPNEHLFKNLKSSDGGSMLLRNDQSCKSQGEWLHQASDV